MVDNPSLEGRWEESFGGHTDSKKRGPSAISFDLTFHNISHVYGIPEHADHFALKSTISREPYRLYNLDVFEYETESSMALYGFNYFTFQILTKCITRFHSFYVGT